MAGRRAIRRLHGTLIRMASATDAAAGVDHGPVPVSTLATNRAVGGGAVEDFAVRPAKGQPADSEQSAGRAGRTTTEVMAHGRLNDRAGQRGYRVARRGKTRSRRAAVRSKSGAARFNCAKGRGVATGTSRGGILTGRAFA